MSQRTFAKVAKIAPSFISNLVTGDRSPPPEKLDEWAEILHLTPTQHRRLRELAAIRHLPAEVQPDMLMVLDRLDHLEALVRKKIGS